MKTHEKQPMARPISKPLPENDRQPENCVKRPSVESSSLNDDLIKRKKSRATGFALSHATAAPTPSSVQLETTRDIALHEMRENKELIRAWEKASAKGRPFFFVVDRAQKTASLSGPVMEGILEQELMANFPPFRQVAIPNVDLYYKKADSEEVFLLVNLAKALVDPSLSSFVTSLCLTESRSTDPDDEMEESANLCTAAACFATGTVVQKDEDLSKHLSSFLTQENRTYGMSIASQVAAFHKKGAMVDFCLRNGADPRIISPSNHRNLLDFLAENKDFLRLAKLLPTLNQEHDHFLLEEMQENPSLTSNKMFQKAVTDALERIKSSSLTTHQ